MDFAEHLNNNAQKQFYLPFFYLWWFPEHLLHITYKYYFYIRQYGNDDNDL